MARPWVPAFLLALRQLGTQAAACRQVGVSYAAVSAARKADADFAAAFDEALEESSDVLEGELLRRAVEGHHEAVIYQGQATLVYERDANGRVLKDEDGAPKLKLDEHGNPVVLTVRKPSDSLLLAAVKARKAAYRTERTELTNPDGSLQPVDEVGRAARIAALLRVAKEREADDAGGLV